MPQKKYCAIFSLIYFFIGGFPYIVHAQKLNWKIISPLPDKVMMGNDNLFISLQINKEYPFASVEKTQVFIDNNIASGTLKVNENKLSFLYTDFLRNGKHTIRVEAKLSGLKYTRINEWTFYVNEQTEGKNVTKSKDPVRLRGTLAIDNRNEFLTGTGQNLRQEPPGTRTLSLDAAVQYKNAEIPIRLFLTSNDIPGQQSMNYYQVGFHNRWLELDYGDLNPCLDKLVLTGVRVKGFKAMLKYKGHSIQVYHGDMRDASEGSIVPYISGGGMAPINDSQAIAPGTYKRTMTAVRVETGEGSGNFKLGFNYLKVLDDVNSIKYGYAPKDNIAGGVDMTVRLFHRALQLQGGFAGSIITNDISNGVLTEKQLDSVYHIKLGFDPTGYKSIIILNSSTVPTSLGSSDYCSYYGQLNFTNKYQGFYAEYKRIGALYNSLGNPFMRSNYEGYSAGERFSLLKRKINIDLRYQNYANDLNAALPSKIFTTQYSGNLFVMPGANWPTLFINYMQQLRNSKNDFDTSRNVKDMMDNIMMTLSLSRTFWNINHNFRISANMNTRSDMLHPANKFTMYNATFGISESISGKYTINADIGKTLMNGSGDNKLSDILVYNLSADWQIKPGKYTAALAASNSQNFATTFSGASYRLSFIARFGYRFWKGMGLDIEGGYQPYRDQTNSTNDFNDSYVYVRYICDLGALTMRK